MAKDRGVPELAGDYAIGSFIPGANVLIQEVIGRGGQGTVYGGEMAVPDPEGQGAISLGKPVALKVIHPHLASDMRMIRSMISEAVTLCSLSHPNIVQIFGAGFTADENKLAYIAMEKLEGMSGRDLLNSKTRIPLQKVLEISVGLASGLAAAHRRGIIHHDIKLENIFVHIDSEGGAFPKLFDWGIRRITSEKAASDPATMITSPSGPPAGAVGTTIPARGDTNSKKTDEPPRTYQGTPAYSAPEQFEGHPATPRTDVYAFGVTLYELITGVRPFHLAEDADRTAKPAPEAGWVRAHSNLIATKRRDDAPKLSRSLPVPPKLEALVARCLARDPASRPADASELESELKELLENLHAYFREGDGLSTQEFLLSAVKSARDSSGSQNVAPKQSAPDSSSGRPAVKAVASEAPSAPLRRPGFAEPAAPSIVAAPSARSYEPPEEALRQVHERKPGFGQPPAPSIVAGSAPPGLEEVEGQGQSVRRPAFEAPARSIVGSSVAPARGEGALASPEAEGDALAEARGESTKSTLEGVAPLTKSAAVAPKAKGAIIGLAVAALAVPVLGAFVVLRVRDSSTTSVGASSSAASPTAAASADHASPKEVALPAKEVPAEMPNGVSAGPSAVPTPTIASAPPELPSSPEVPVASSSPKGAPPPASPESNASSHTSRSAGKSGASKAHPAPSSSGNPALTKLLN